MSDSSPVAAGNVELHKRVLAAFNAHDVEALLERCDPEMEFHALRDLGVSGDELEPIAP